MPAIANADLSSIQFLELSDKPSTPGAGKWRIYTKAGGVYVVDDNGAEVGPFGPAGAGDMDKATYDNNDDGTVDAADYATSAGDADTVDGSHAADFVPSTRTVNGLALSSDITISTAGAALISEYLFCDDVIFGGTSPPWHELEKQSDGGTTGSHTATTTSYTELDRYVTDALGSTKLPGGLWTFTLFCKMSAQSGQVKAEVYRVDTAGAIVGGVLGTAESAAFANTTTSGIVLSVYISEKTGWALTDRVGVVLSGKKIGAPAATLTFYHDLSSGWGSCVSTPLSLLHDQLGGLNEGDYRHLTKTQYDDLTDGGETTLHTHPGGGGDVATDVIWDAKGDLAVGTGANTATRLPVGSNGKIIVADSGEASGLKWITNDHILTLGVSGTLSVAAGTMRLHVPWACTVTNVRAMVGTAPTGASVIVDVNKNGATIFSTQGNRPTITTGNYTDLSAVPDTTAIAADDYITIDVDNIGSGTPGGNLVVQILVTIP